MSAALLKINTRELNKSETKVSPSSVSTTTLDGEKNVLADGGGAPCRLSLT